MVKIAPSILAADFTRLGDEVNSVERGGADYLHVDVMDGLFVPNISIGVPVVESLRQHTDMFLDVHLMIERPQRYVETFCKAGADLLTIHAEAAQPQDLLTAIECIHSCGKRVGMSLKPRTPATVILPYLDMLDLVLIMTVEPGFGGQHFMADQLPKIEAVSQMIAQKGLSCEIEVDGGIDVHTAPLVSQAGARVLVAGSAVFHEADRHEAIEHIRRAAIEAAL